MKIMIKDFFLNIYFNHFFGEWKKRKKKKASEEDLRPLAPDYRALGHMRKWVLKEISPQGLMTYII